MPVLQRQSAALSIGSDGVEEASSESYPYHRRGDAGEGEESSDGSRDAMPLRGGAADAAHHRLNAVGSDLSDDEEVDASARPREPVSTARLYKQLKGIFDNKPVQHDATPTILLPYEVDSHGWGESNSSRSTTPPPHLSHSPPPQQQQQQVQDPTRGSKEEEVEVEVLLSASIMDFNKRKREGEVALARARSPHAAFAMTEFLEPVSGEAVFEPAAALLAERIRLDDPEGTVNFVVSAGLRGCGALAQAVALELGVAYSLSNWYPDGSGGDCRVDRCQGIGSPGWVYLNGVPLGSRVAVVLDVVRTGVTAARLVEGILGIEACSVLGVYAVGATVEWKPPHTCTVGEVGEGRGASAFAEEEEEPRLNDYYHYVEYHPHPTTTTTITTGAAAVPTGSVGGAQQRQGEGKGLAAASPTAPSALRHSSHLPPPLRALFLISLAGELTHVLTRKEREAEWHAASQQVLLSPPSRVALSTSPRLRKRQLCLASLYEPCFPAECPPPRRLPADAVNQIKRMPRAEVLRKQRRVAASFTGVPIVTNKAVGGYPYCFFALTDFQPALTPSLVEDMADLAVHDADLKRCEVLVSEGDRGGGPLLHAISLRTHQPYVIASWSVPATADSTQSLVPASGGGACADLAPSAARQQHGGRDGAAIAAASGVVQVGFGGSHCQLSLAGLRHGTRCAFVDDMLSSGGTAEAVLRCIVELGAMPVEAVFVSEKLYPHHQRRYSNSNSNSIATAGARGEAKVRDSSSMTEPHVHSLPVRKGWNRLMKLFPDIRITCLSQFVVEGSRTVEPPCWVGD